MITLSDYLSLKELTTSHVRQTKSYGHDSLE